MKCWYDPEEDNKEIVELYAEGTHDQGPDEDQTLRRTSHSNVSLPPEQWSYLSEADQEEAQLRGGDCGVCYYIVYIGSAVLSDSLLLCYTNVALH